MKNFPLDEIIQKLKDKGSDPIKFFKLFIELKETIVFGAALKRIQHELEKYETLILKVLKPSIDKETKKARYKNSFKPSEFLIDPKNGQPFRLNGFRDEYRRQFIQIAYIGLYHKTENAEKELLLYFNKALSSRYKDLSEINFNYKDKHIFDVRDRIREVANCFKHNQGLANLQLCTYYKNCEQGKPMSLNFVNFRKDINDLKKYNLQLSFYLSLYFQKKSANKLIKSGYFEEETSLTQTLIEMKKETKQLLKMVSKENIFKKKSGR